MPAVMATPRILSGLSTIFSRIWKGRTVRTCSFGCLLLALSSAILFSDLNGGQPVGKTGSGNPGGRDGSLFFPELPIQAQNRLFLLKKAAVNL